MQNEIPEEYVFTDPEVYQLLALKGALKLQIAGIQIRRGLNPHKRLQEILKVKLPKEKMLVFVESIVEEIFKQQKAGNC